MKNRVIIRPRTATGLECVYREPHGSWTVAEIFRERFTGLLVVGHDPNIREVPPDGELLRPSQQQRAFYNSYFTYSAPAPDWYDGLCPLPDRMTRPGWRPFSEREQDGSRGENGSGTD